MDDCCGPGSTGHCVRSVFSFEYDVTAFAILSVTAVERGVLDSTHYHLGDDIVTRGLHPEHSS